LYIVLGMPTRIERTLAEVRTLQNSSEVGLAGWLTAFADIGLATMIALFLWFRADAFANGLAANGEEPGAIFDEVALRRALFAFVGLWLGAYGLLDLAYWLPYLRYGWEGQTRLIYGGSEAVLGFAILWCNSPGIGGRLWRKVVTFYNPTDEEESAPPGA
jgi:hypothetical protein